MNNMDQKLSALAASRQLALPEGNIIVDDQGVLISWPSVNAFGNIKPGDYPFHLEAATEYRGAE